MPTRRTSRPARFLPWPRTRRSSRVALSTAAGILLGAYFLIGCGDAEGEGRGGPTEPGFSTPNIRGVYSAPTFWTFETLQLADGARDTWNCMGNVTIVRQTVTDFLGTFLVMPPDPQRCEFVTGNVSAGVISEGARISFATSVPGQESDEFLAPPGCAVVTQEPLWTGSIVGERMVASRGLTVDCPAGGRVQITGRVEGPRTTVFESD